MLFSCKGVPQGSILSPILFNLYLSRCGSSVSDGCRLVQFADDIALYIRSSDLDFSRVALERAVGALSTLLLDRGLVISPSKSALMIFTRKRTNYLNYSISLNNADIFSVSSYRFLGVLMEPHLTGKLR